MFVDLDHFKLVNDRSGHAAGDLVLRAVANAILESTRDTDLTARIGGDEFVIVAPEMSYNAAQHYTERLQQQLRQAMQRGGWPVTFSIGAATFNYPPLLLDDVVKVADDLMYDVKHKQKDAVHLCLVEAADIDETPRWKPASVDFAALRQSRQQPIGQAAHLARAIDARHHRAAAGQQVGIAEYFVLVFDPSAFRAHHGGSQRQQIVETWRAKNTRSRFQPRPSGSPPLPPAGNSFRPPAKFRCGPARSR